MLTDLQSNHYLGFFSNQRLVSHLTAHSDFREFLCFVCGTAVKNREYLAKYKIILSQLSCIN